MWMAACRTSCSKKENMTLNDNEVTCEKCRKLLGYD
jgi:hypothetical protein